MALDDYPLEKCAFEARYEPSLLHWDRAGRFWVRMQRQWPDLKNVTAEPGRTVFALGRDYQLILHLDRANIVTDHPQDMDEFARLAESMLTGVKEDFDVTEYTRVGLRMTFFRKLASQSDAAEALMALKLVNVDQDRYYNADGPPNNLSFGARWKGERFGASLSINTEGRKIEFTPPFGIKEVEPFNETQYGMTVDVDYYSTQAIPTGQFSTTEWMKQAEHLIRRDTNRILDGAMRK